MALSSSQHNQDINVRPCNYRDLEAIEVLVDPSHEGFNTQSRGLAPWGVARDLHNLRRWYVPSKLLSLFPNPLRNLFSAYVAESQGKAHGVIQVAPFNRTRSTWRIERIVADAVKLPSAEAAENGIEQADKGAASAASTLASAKASVAERQAAACGVVNAEAIANGHGKHSQAAHGHTKSSHAKHGSRNGSGRSNSTSMRLMQSAEVASQLLRYCLTTIWEARTWLVEVGVNDKDGMGLYRQNGFQPLAQITYWQIPPTLLSVLAEREADLPNLRPVSNSDAPLLHQLDTVSMPPLVRQVFDRHVSDFKKGLVQSMVDSLMRLMRHHDQTRGYVFEPQRKAAIGYFHLQISQDGRSPHQAHFTVHPAYTWLYPEMLSYMARLLQNYPPQALAIASSDYQPEREEYLEKIGAERTEHSLMMSRSVWHKVRETKPATEGLQLSEVLQGLQPSRKPVPGRFSWIPPLHPMPPKDASNSSESQSSQGSRSQSNHSSFPPNTDSSDSAQWPQDGAT